MTKSVWHFLLTCLLLMTLPAQGFAAIGMAACCANHHSGSGALSLAGNADKLAQLLPGPASHHQAVTSQADAAGKQLGRAGMSSPEAGAPANPGTTDSHLKCKNCTPCCVSAMLTSDIVTPLAMSAGKAEFPALVISPARPPTGSLERPPRPRLA